MRSSLVLALAARPVVVLARDIALLAERRVGRSVAVAADVRGREDGAPREGRRGGAVRSVLLQRHSDGLLEAPRSQLKLELDGCCDPPPLAVPPTRSSRSAARPLSLEAHARWARTARPLFHSPAPGTRVDARDSTDGELEAKRGGGDARRRGGTRSKTRGGGGGKGFCSTRPAHCLPEPDDVQPLPSDLVYDA